MKKGCKKNYFEGWYFKNYNGDFTIAFIPSYHIDRKGKFTAYLQVITDNDSYMFEYDKTKFIKDKKCLFLNVEHCIFCKDHIDISIESDKAKIKGELNFTNLTPIKSDIMGVFKYVPFMQCRHQIISIYHRVNGYIRINGLLYEFKDGLGYIESDKGKSFPKKYLWTHCNIDNNKTVITLSVATVKALGIGFSGVIGIVYYKGKQYRFATYLGAKITKWKDKKAIIDQGDMRLSVEQLSARNHSLKAPVKGMMERTIKESPSCKARYTFTIKEKKIIDTIAHNASFESVFN